MLVNNQPNSSAAGGGASHGHASSGPPGSGAPRMPAIVGQLNLVLHVSVALVSLSIAFVLFDSSLFGWHPLFMSVGFLLFMTEGLMSAVMFRHLDGPERVKAIWSHALMQARAVTCIIVGFAVIYQNKVIHNKKHFQTRHAQFGLATVVLSILAPLLGVISFKRLGFIQGFPEAWQPRLKYIHRKGGLVTWLLALVTIELALPHPAVKRAFLTPVWRVAVGAIGVLLLLLMQKAQVKLKNEQEDRSLAKAV